MKSYKQWFARARPDEGYSTHFRNGWALGSSDAWEYRTNSFKIQQRLVTDMRKELDRALTKGARAVKTNQLIKQRADRLERENRNLTTQLRIARDG